MPKFATKNGYGRKKRRRVFLGKKVEIAKDPPSSTSPAPLSTLAPTLDSVVPTCTPSTAPKISTSKRKIDLFKSHSNSVGELPANVTTDSSYRIIDLQILRKMIGSLVCPTCHQTAELTEKTVYGLASKLGIYCYACDDDLYSEFSAPMARESRAYDINQRFVYSCKANGLGYQQATSFLAHMNLPPPICDTAFQSKLYALSESCDTALRDHLKIVHEIVRCEYIKAGHASEDDEKINISVSFDGTWQKRGHTSHNGVGVAIDILTGYVVDFEVLSNICVTCEREKPKEDDRSLKDLQQYLSRHKETCEQNYEGSSNAMEVEAARRIWRRSADAMLQYTTMLSDGDSRAFDAVCAMEPYGATKIQKEECVNHVAKRLTAALEELKSKGGPDGKSLGGRGMLTKKTIQMLQSHYANAIKKHPGDVESTQREIMAAPYHITSTDEAPDHRYCPDNSWCWFKNPTKKQTSHQPDLPKQMLEIILPVYERLSTRALLERCARVATQNANECVNGIIWKRCPKVQWYGRRSVMIGATMGVLVFNSGEAELQRIEAAYGLHTGELTVSHAEKKDRKRCKRDATCSRKRKARAHRLVTERDRQIRKEGVTYEAGKFGA